MALHAAIAWSVFARDGRRRAGCCSACSTRSGKYLFVVGRRPRRWRRDRGTPATAGDARSPAAPVGRRPRGLVRLAGHADVRWHLWIVLAVVGPARPGPGRLRRLLPGPGAAAARSRKAVRAMPEPARSRVLILARDEAENLPGCLASVALGRRGGRRRRPRQPRRDPGDRPARRRRRRGPRRSTTSPASGTPRSTWPRATGSSRSTPTSGPPPSSPPRSARAIADPAGTHAGYRVPIRSVILGRPFRLLGDAARPPAPPLPPRTRADGSAPSTRRSSSTGRSAGCGTRSSTGRSPTCRRSSARSTSTRRSKRHKFDREGRRFRAGDLALRPVLDVRQALPRQAGVPRRRSKGSSSAPCRASRWRSGTGSTASWLRAGGRHDVTRRPARGRGRLAVRPAPAAGSSATVGRRRLSGSRRIVAAPRDRSTACGSSTSAAARGGSPAPLRASGRRGRRARSVGRRCSAEAGGHRPRPRLGPAAAVRAGDRSTP